MRSTQANLQPSLSNSLIFTISKFRNMKKTYISPEALSISLDPKMPLLLGYSRMIAEEEQYTKEYNFVDDEEDDVPAGGSIKNIWSEEW